MVRQQRSPTPLEACGAGGERCDSTAMKVFRRSALPVVALLASMMLHGCDVPPPRGFGWFMLDAFDVPTHRLANWRMKPDYWVKNGYVNPETGEEQFNSCMNKELSVINVCNGHGRCAPFDKADVEVPVFFCSCDPAWAGMECKDKRKSQIVAWTLSLFFGPLALDEMYLGNDALMFDKVIIVLLGGVLYFTPYRAVGTSLIVFTWLFDACRIGMGEIRANPHRVEGDLPRAVFAIVTIIFFCFIACIIGLSAVHRKVSQRRRDWDERITRGYTMGK